LNGGNLQQQVHANRSIKSNENWLVAAPHPVAEKSTAGGQRGQIQAE
jgi:hypothetical protein